MKLLERAESEEPEKKEGEGTIVQAKLRKQRWALPNVLQLVEELHGQRGGNDIIAAADS